MKRTFQLRIVGAVESMAFLPECVPRWSESVTRRRRKEKGSFCLGCCGPENGSLSHKREF